MPETNPTADPEDLLRAAERISEILEQMGLEALVIGGVALAAHRYIRLTDDFDLAIDADLPRLRAITESLRKEGFTVELREPDLDDPLGGVIDVAGPFGLVQVISFANRFPGVLTDALRESCQVLRSGSRLRLIPLPHLIALKLYAGGHKSKADIVELLLRNSEADISKIRQLCDRYRLPGLDELLREAGRLP